MAKFLSCEGLDYYEHQNYSYHCRERFMPNDNFPNTVNYWSAHFNKYLIVGIDWSLRNLNSTDLLIKIIKLYYRKSHQIGSQSAGSGPK